MYYAHRKICRETLAIATTALIQQHRHEKESGTAPELSMWDELWNRGYNWKWHGMVWDMDPMHYSNQLSEESYGFDFYSAIKNDRLFKVGFAKSCSYAIADLMKHFFDFNTRCKIVNSESKTGDVVAETIELLFQLSGKIGNTNNTELAILTELPAVYKTVYNKLHLPPSNMMELSGWLYQLKLGMMPSGLDENQERCQLITDNWNKSFGWD